MNLRANKQDIALKNKLDQLQKDHQFNISQKEKEYNKLTSQIKEQERERDKYVEKLDKLRKREEAAKRKYAQNHKGDPKGSMPSLDVIKSMDLDDIDLITERLWKYGLTFKDKSDRKKPKRHPKVPKLDLEIVFKMIEKENEYDEYEEEEEEADEDCASGKIICIKCQINSFV